jgi:hypothetical protein
MKNRVSADDLLSMTASQIAALSVEELEMIAEDIAETGDNLKAIKDKYEDALSLRYAKRAEGLRAAADKDYGTVRVSDGAYEIVADMGKTVTWDQKKLAEVWRLIESWDEKPAEYIKIKYDVSETAFKAWPKKLQDVFMAARTTKPKKETFKIERRG